jgi:hypothetical protein
MVAMHLANALQHAGKSVLLSDRLQARALRPAPEGVTCIHLDLERPGLHRSRLCEPTGLAAGGGCEVDVRGVDRHRAGAALPHGSTHSVTLSVTGTTIGRRLQKALSMADTIGAALH